MGALEQDLIFDIDYQMFTAITVPDRKVFYIYFINK